MAMEFDRKDEDFDEADDKKRGTDYARGERKLPVDPMNEHSDFARGERTLSEDFDTSSPDYARGEHQLDSDIDRQGPDYARGQRHDSERLGQTASDMPAVEHNATAFDRIESDYKDTRRESGNFDTARERMDDSEFRHDEHLGHHHHPGEPGYPDRGDFARGERRSGTEFEEGPDYARGERTDLNDADTTGPDFARGLRTDPTLDDVEGPDFARGQHELDETDDDLTRSDTDTAI